MFMLLFCSISNKGWDNKLLFRVIDGHKIISTIVFLKVVVADDAVALPHFLLGHSDFRAHFKEKKNETWICVMLCSLL